MSNMCHISIYVLENVPIMFVFGPPVILRPERGLGKPSHNALPLVQLVATHFSICTVP